MVANQIDARALSPDGRSLAVANRGPDKFVKVLAISGGELRTLITWKEGVFPNKPVWTPDGRHILFLRNRCHELWSISPEGGEPRMLDRMDFQMDYPSIHPNGRTIVFGGKTWPDVSGIWVSKGCQALSLMWPAPSTCLFGLSRVLARQSPFQKPGFSVPACPWLQKMTESRHGDCLQCYAGSRWRFCG